MPIVSILPMFVKCGKVININPIWIFIKYGLEIKPLQTTKWQPNLKSKPYQTTPNESKLEKPYVAFSDQIFSSSDSLPSITFLVPSWPYAKKSTQSKEGNQEVRRSPKRQDKKYT